MIPQQTIAHYRITAKLGQGGMGEVWRAVDTKLGRDVAVKVLPGSFALDAERMARFECEAKLLASLNHPNIVQIYGVEDCALVMELVEGQTLKGPLSLETALAYARQIADALEAAHEKGIVHRDLKPGNIMVTPAGAVKVLDFGLARVAEEAAGDPENSPTVTISPTRTGAILGTAEYMSPEQARGKPVDKRADIWAFGCVLYEMLTGKPAFPGDTTTDILAGVVGKDPDLTRVPLQVRRLLERCLEKDPRKRLRDIGDVWELLDSAEASAAAKGQWPWIIAATLAIALIITGAFLWRATRPLGHALTRLNVDLGPDAVVGLSTTVAISPDGRRLVFPARGPHGKQLAIRLLDQAQATLLPGTENGQDAFFSPDGQWVGFFADGKLRKISVQGGAPVTLCDATFPLGGSWGEDGNVVAALNNVSPLSRVPASGGTPQPLTKLAGGEVTHRWPQVLPGGQAVLFTSAQSILGLEDANIEVVLLKTGATKIVQRGGYYGRYLPGGHLLYVHQGVLFGVGFDAASLETRGSTMPLAGDLAGDSVLGGGQFDFSGAPPSGTGTLVYLAGNASSQSWPIIWLDSSGKTEPLLRTPVAYYSPHFSPDGRRLALTLSSKGNDIFVYDWQRDAMTRLTFDGQSGTPVWSPDGRHIAFGSSSVGGSISWVRSDGAGEPQHLLENQSAVFPWSSSPDGRRLAYMKISPETGYDLWTLPLDVSNPDHPKPGKPEPFLRTPFDELLPVFSPDGRWIAYASNESGRREIYVRPFAGDGGGGRWQISSDGGSYAFWSNNARELFYETTDYRIMVVDYTVNGDSFVPGTPRVWSGKPIFYPGLLNLALHPDGKRFAVFPMPEVAGGEKGTVHVTMLLNFLDELKRRIP